MLEVIGVFVGYNSKIHNTVLFPQVLSCDYVRAPDVRHFQPVCLATDVSFIPHLH